MQQDVVAMAGIDTREITAARQTPLREPGGIGGFRPTRVESIDVVRGVIMILMTLDHTRDFFGIPADPTNLAVASPALFFTRWFTHFCAPVFCLLMGTGAYLAGRRKSPAELSFFLFTRGIWLIFLELVLARCFIYLFNVDYKVTMLIVLWSLGWALIALAALVRLPLAVVTAFGVVMILGHNLFDSVTWNNSLWTILHRPGFVFRSTDHAVFVAYPLIPWIGVAAIGYCLGRIYSWESDRRRAFLIQLGVTICLAFLVIRGLNIYGDPRPWARQSTWLYTVLSFLNTTKYPPSLSFLLMTLGPAVVFLWAVERRTPGLLRPAVVIGRVPLFYYLLHFVLIRLVAIVICYLRYGSAHWMFESPDLANYPFTAPPGWGYSLATVYLLWALIVTMMYPPCRWFAALKQRRRDAWLSYL
jgi:uncharacterized membrane protein